MPGYRPGPSGSIRCPPHPKRRTNTRRRQNKILETFAFLTKSRIWNSFNILGIYVMDIYSYRYVIIQLFVLICFVYFLYEHEKRSEMEE